jgi:hypothetical protein
MNFGFYPFSWASLAGSIAIALGCALWRLGREDEGKVARDAAWWRAWWQMTGFWCGLLLLACIVRSLL